MAKATANVPAFRTVTLEELDAKIAVVQKDMGRRDAASDKAKAHIGELHLFAGLYSASTQGAFKVEDMLDRYYGADKVKGWNPDTLKSRKSEWNCILDAGRAAPQLFNPDDKDGNVWAIAGGVNKMRQLCRFLKDNPSATVETLKAEKKKTEEREDSSTDGDKALEGCALFANIADETLFAEMRPHLAALQGIIKAKRAAGGLRTKAEIRAAERQGNKTNAKKSLDDRLALAVN
jgi:hypothetical protein